MATDSQIAANRINAQKCTGPTTTEGKAASSQNAVKTGLYAKSNVIATENRDDYETLIAEYYDRFNPTTPEERCLVDTLISSEWMGRRYTAAATGIWEYQLRNMKEQDLGVSFIHCAETLSRAQRCITVNQRNYAHALKQLHTIQSARAKRAAAPASDPAPGPLADNVTEPFTPKLVSFRQPTEVPAETAPTHPQTEDSPPIAA